MCAVPNRRIGVELGKFNNIIEESNMRLFNKRCPLGHAVSISMCLAAATLQAPYAYSQGEDESVLELDEIVVTGIRYENKLAIEQKRNNTVIGEFLASDDIGKFVDFDIADSLRRVSGVTTIFVEEEGQYVAMRGLDADFTHVTIDGISVAAVDLGGDFGGGRRVLLESVPSSSVKSLEILKTVTADMDGQGIGGHVNLVTRSAADADGMFFVANVSIGHYDKNVVPMNNYKPAIRGDFVWSDLFGSNDEFGLMLSGSYSHKERDVERVVLVNQRWRDPSGALVTPTEGDDSLGWGVYIPRISFDNVTTRYGGLVKLEYMPDDRLYSSLSINYYKVDEREQRAEVVMGGLVDARNGNVLSINNGWIQRRHQKWDIEKTVLNINHVLDYDFSDDDQIALTTGYSESRWYEDAPRVRFKDLIMPFAYTAAINGTAPPTVTMADNSTNVAANYYRPDVNWRTDDDKQKLFETNLTYAHNLDVGDAGLGFKTGIKYRSTDKKWDRDVLLYGEPFNGAALGVLDFTDVQTNADVNYSVPGQEFSQMFIDVDLFLQMAQNAPAGTIDFNEAGTISSSTNGDFSLTEKVLAAFAMVEYRGDNFSVNAGLRVEHTELDVLVLTTENASGKKNRKGSYGNILPSATFNYDATENLKMRVAYSRTIGRPSLSAVSGAVSVTDDGLGVTTINQGNPDLRPRISDNFDVSMEYYSDDGEDMAAIGLFYKDISDNIFTRTTILDGGATILNQPENVESSSVTGIELTLIKSSLDFLPEPFSNFGASMNATFISATQNLSENENINYLREQPEYIFNASLFYENEVFDARLTVNHTGEYAKTIILDPLWLSQWREALTQVDFSAGFQVKESLKITADIRNLTDEKQVISEGPDQRALRDYSEYGRSFWIGVSYKFN